MLCCLVVMGLERESLLGYVQKRLFDEERAVRGEGESELLGHRLVDAAVEVDAGVHAEGFDCPEALHSRKEGGRRVQPAEVGGCVHFYGGEALGFAGGAM